MSVLSALHSFWGANLDDTVIQRLVYAGVVSQSDTGPSRNIALALAQYSGELDPQVYRGLFSHLDPMVQAAVWARGQEPEAAVKAMVADVSQPVCVHQAALAYDGVLDEGTAEQLMQVNEGYLPQVLANHHRYSARIVLSVLSNNPHGLRNHFSGTWSRPDVVKEVFAHKDKYPFAFRVAACAVSTTPIEYVRQMIDELSTVAFNADVWFSLQRVLLHYPLPKAEVAKIFHYGVFPDKQASSFALRRARDRALSLPLDSCLFPDADVYLRQFAWVWATDADRVRCAAMAVIQSTARSTAFLQKQALDVLMKKHQGDTDKVSSELIAAFTASGLLAENFFDSFWMIKFPKFFFFIFAKALEKGNSTDDLFFLLEEADAGQLDVLNNWLEDNVKPTTELYTAATHLMYELEPVAPDADQLWCMSFADAAETTPTLAALQQLAAVAGDDVVQQIQTVRLWSVLEQADPLQSIGNIVAARAVL